jgi:methyl-accepting chemotaxis protein
VLTKIRGLRIASVLFLLTLVLAACDSKQNAAPRELKIENEVISNTTDANKKAVVNEFLETKKVAVIALAKEFGGFFPGNFTLDSSETKTLDGGVTVPTLKYEGHSLHLDHMAADKFTAQHSAVATIFVRSGNEFVRILTSVKKEDGSRAFGTALDHKHPAYIAATAGNGYYNGTATLFGMIYMTDYSPITDKTGNIIGLMFVGTDITADLIPLKAKLS